MKVQEIVNTLGLTIAAGKSGLNREITGGYVSDLLSDVMGRASEGEVWITLQTHKNVMAIASLKELAAIIIVQGLKPDADLLKQAEGEEIPVLITDKSTFEITGLLFNLLK
ncbi:MAG: DRTGG domain-containing protein [Salinivirgaceae bacterium]|nr:DRTGG domain-containing protein [Salinivirgaceae bacterium]MDD4746257.1 DRTGG domain-containing protein [Salinivirgaceae bacterium]MDY0281488.1 DRTGG domain-containing protein [Salinivirgaceae bacterium]